MISDTSVGRDTRPTRYGTRAGEASWLINLRVVERHVGVVIAILFFPLNAPLAILLVASYLLRVWALEGVYHRYFAHRSYNVSRGMQFLLALIGIQCGLRGPLWWAAKHRVHHQAADTKDDPHSPVVHPFAYAYLRWFASAKNASTDLDAVPDLSCYSELRWLDRWYLPVFYGGAVVVFLTGYFGLLGPRVTGISALLWGFYVPSFLQVHAIAMLNTFGHMRRWPGGYRRFATDDHSMNRPFLALATLGAGWHNNHHRYPNVGRAGFAWYELDLSYLFLRLLQGVGLIRDLKTRLPEHVRREGRLD